MEPIPLVRASVVLPFTQFLDQIGAPTEKLLQKAHLPIGSLDSPENLVPLNQCFDLVELAARSQGIEHLGVLVGEQTHLSDLGNFGAIVLQSLTLHDLIRKVIQFHCTLLNGEKIWFTEDGEYLWLHHQYTVPRHIKTYQGQSFSLLMYINIIRLGGGLHWQPDRLHIQSGKNTALLAAKSFSNTQISFNQSSHAFRFPQAFLSQPLMRDRSALSAESSLDTNQLTSTAPATSFRDSLYQLLQVLLPQGEFNLNIAAEASGCSVRTFQRRLEEYNLNYSQLVDQVRFEQAVKLLQDPTRPLIEIAFDLGYSDAANFTRAFKRWTSVSPREFRRLHLQQ